MTNDEVRRLAREMYGSDDVEIEADAGISPAEDGNWVNAWVWVPKKEEDEDDE